MIRESPKYYIASDRLDKAMYTLEQLASRNKKDLPEGTLVPANSSAEEHSLGNPKDLVPNRTYAELTFLVTCIWMLTSFIYYGVILLTPCKFPL